MTPRELPPFCLMRCRMAARLCLTAGSFAGSSAADLLQYLVAGKNPLEIAIGLATANALIDPPRGCYR